MRRTVFAAAATASLILSASAALAAPDRSLRLSSDSRTASWTGRVNVGPHVAYSDLTDPVRCPTPCDQTLIYVSDPGSVLLVVKKSGPLSSNDYYVIIPTLHRSDAEGSKLARIQTGYAHNRDSEVLTTGPIRPGFYLFEVETREGAGYYTGTATLSPAKKR